MRLVFGRDQLVAQWIEDTYGESMGGKPGFAWGVVNGNDICGAFVVTLEHNRTAELHVFGRVSNDTVRDMFKAVFADLNVYRLQVRTAKKNKTVRKAAPKYGFKYEATLKHFYGPGEDAYSYFMTPQDCRWIKDGIAV